jgi:quinol-cytochrome oxidoreductase complex cytochrome b subunit
MLLRACLHHAAHNPVHLTSVRPSFFHHLHPPTIPAPQARLRYTLAAGGLAVFLTLVLVITGIIEMFYYVPTPDNAALSIQTLTYLVPFGSLVRSVHYWAAQLLVLVALVHLLRVIFTSAYAKHRRVNYLLGLVLLVVCLFLDFSGYVLRWDEGIHWAMVAGTNLVKTIPVIGPGLYGMLVGGVQPGPATLVRFYAWHIFGLTLVLLAIGIWHVFRVRRDGGIAVPPPEERRDPSRITRFELVRREGLAALLATVILVVLALVSPAPISPPLEEAASLAADGRAPWFFLWVQELLRLGNPFLWGVLAPLAILAWFALIPYILPSAQPNELGSWFPRGNRLAQVSAGLIAVILLALTLLAVIQSGGI